MPVEVDMPLPINGNLAKEEDEALQRVQRFLKERGIEVDDGCAMRVSIMVADVCRMRRQTDFWAAAMEWAERNGA